MPPLKTACRLLLITWAIAFCWFTHTCVMLVTATPRQYKIDRVALNEIQLEGIAPEDNAAPLLVEAWIETFRVVGEVDWPDPDYRWDDNDLDYAREFVDSIRHTFPLIEQAIQRPHLVFEIDKQGRIASFEDVPKGVDPIIDRWRNKPARFVTMVGNLGFVQISAARVAVRDEDWDAYLHHMNCAIGLFELSRRSPQLFELYTGVEILSNVDTEIRARVASNDYPEHVSESLRNRISEIEPFRGPSRGMLATYEANSRASLASEYDEYGYPIFAATDGFRALPTVRVHLSSLLGLGLPRYTTALARLERYFMKTRDWYATERPWLDYELTFFTGPPLLRQDTATPTRNRERRIENLWRLRRWTWDCEPSIAGDLAPHYHTNTQRAIMLTTLRLHEYRLQRGRLPNSVADAVPIEERTCPDGAGQITFPSVNHNLGTAFTVRVPQYLPTGSGITIHTFSERIKLRFE